MERSPGSHDSLWPAQQSTNSPPELDSTSVLFVWTACKCPFPAYTSIRLLVQLWSHCFCSGCMVWEKSSAQAEGQWPEPSPVAGYLLRKYVIIIFSSQSARYISRSWCLFLVVGFVGMVLWVQAHASAWSLLISWLLRSLSLGSMCREALAASQEQWIRREGCS